MSAPLVKGWCPGAWRPMISGDGLVIRVRPFRSELTAAQALVLCNLAQRYGNGVIDLTSRANLQIRGVAEADHGALLSELAAAALIDEDPGLESRRNILVPALRKKGGLTDRLYDALMAALPQLPALPEKMGYAIDTAAQACLAEAPADFRFELDEDGTLLLRADSAPKGRPVSAESAMDALAEMISWFLETGGQSRGRMARHLPHQPLPADWTSAAPRPLATPEPGEIQDGLILGAPFGKLDAGALRDLLKESSATQMRLMPGRLFFLAGAGKVETGFITRPGDPLMKAHACPGAPLCPQASVATMALARQLAPRVTGSLHVSGCAKGCARNRPASLTLTGREGRFDLVRNGTTKDAPALRGLTPDQIGEML